MTCVSAVVPYTIRNVHQNNNDNHTEHNNTNLTNNNDDDDNELILSRVDNYTDIINSFICVQSFNTNYDAFSLMQLTFISTFSLSARDNIVHNLLTRTTDNMSQLTKHKIFNIYLYKKHELTSYRLTNLVSILFQLNLIHPFHVLFDYFLDETFHQHDYNNNNHNNHNNKLVNEKDKIDSVFKYVKYLYPYYKKVKEIIGNNNDGGIIDGKVGDLLANGDAVMTTVDNIIERVNEKTGEANIRVIHMTVRDEIFNIKNKQKK
jgi:hypothetical protein